MKRSRALRLTAAIALTCALASGCSMLGSKEASKEIDPPPPGMDGILDTMEPLATSGQEQSQQVKTTLYFKNQNGLVAPVSVSIPMTEKLAQRSLELMVEGNEEAAEILPEGFTGLIPAGTKVQGINIVNKTAVVDFSKQFTQYDAQNERKILEAITWTLTGFPTVEKVQLWVNGTLLKQMPAGGFPLDEPLDRKIGINLERPTTVNIGNTMPVTVYFQSMTSDGNQYYVPVTRMIERNANVAQAALDQLLAGPTEASGLEAVFPDGSKVLNVSVSDGIVTVNLDKNVMGPEEKAPAETLQSVILSLTENTGASKVQIMVNGSVQVTDTLNQKYDRPVTKPKHVNDIKA